MEWLLSLIYIQLLLSARETVSSIMSTSTKPPEPDSTPIKVYILNRHHAIAHPVVKDIRTQLRNDMDEKFLRVSYEDFMGTYFPIPTNAQLNNFQGHFNAVRRKKSTVRNFLESHLYNPFVSSLEPS